MLKKHSTYKFLLARCLPFLKNKLNFSNNVMLYHNRILTIFFIWNTSVAGRSLSNRSLKITSYFLMKINLNYSDLSIVMIENTSVEPTATYIPNHGFKLLLSTSNNQTGEPDINVFYKHSGSHFSKVLSFLLVALVLMFCIWIPLFLIYKYYINKTHKELFFSFIW